MSELFRFRRARAPQRMTVKDDGVLAVGKLAPFDKKSLDATASNTVIPDALVELDTWLTSRNNQPDILSFTEAVKNPATLVTTKDWWIEREALRKRLTASVSQDASVRAKPARMLLVMGLVELYASQPDRLRSAADVYNALRWRKLVLPPGDWPKARPLKLAHRVGFADLFVVRRQWNRYEAGEISHIENVLGGESKAREHVRTTEAEDIFTTETERTEVNEHDSQSTDRFELKTESDIDSTLAAHIEGKIDTSGQYGPTHIDTHIGGSLDYSVEQSESLATTQSHEIVARAATRVEEKVQTLRTSRSLVRVTETNKHALVNKNQAPIVGVYRWVDRIDRVELVRYPHRFLVEFQVPEPAAWLRWAHRGDSDRGFRYERPSPFTRTGDAQHDILSVTDINEGNYAMIASRYMTTGLKPPPDNSDVVVSVSLKRDAPDEEHQSDVVMFDSHNTTAAVPDRYQAATWRASILSFPNPLQGGAPTATIYVSVGAGEPQSLTRTLPETPTGNINGSVGPISIGNVPVAVMANMVWGYTINVEITCSPRRGSREQWQAETYDRIAAAYDIMLRRYDEERSARDVQAGFLGGESSSERNKEIVREELKRQVIEMLTGSEFKGKNALVKSADQPKTNLTQAMDVASEIQFLEQAFEWENMTYVLYPYYWADQERWRELQSIEVKDTDFSRFLRCGSARVVVPARPRFADEVQFYIYFGVIWGGGLVPVPGDEEYLSVAEEIKSQQLAPADGTVLDSWEVRLPTTLVWLQNKTPLPKNDNSEINRRGEGR